MRLCGILLLFFLGFIVMGVDAPQEKSESLEKQLKVVSDKLTSLPVGDDKAAKELLKYLEEQSRSRDLYIKYSARHALATYFLKNDKLNDAWKTVKDCDDGTNIQKMLGQDYGTAWLQCHLDAAVCKLKQKKPHDALQMLSRAEGLASGYDKVLVQLKCAELMLTPEINQVDKASEYLKQAQTECARKIATLKDNMSVAGQAKAKDDSLPQWEALQKDIGLQAIELEFRQLEVNYGRDYADYVKMRKLYQSGFSEKAENLCNEIVKQNKSAENVYVASARLLSAKCALRDRRLSPDEQIKRAEEQLEKFIKDQPYGLYRGEAWMELGRIELEQNWDSDAAAKYYGKALEWFRYIRNLNDAMEIYAVPDKVGDVSKPQGKYTSLDQWKRTVYRTENEREIINQKTAPWYPDEKEKQCLFLVGFFKFINNDLQGAKDCWTNAGNLDSDIMKLHSQNWPNALMRLEAAAEYGQMLFSAEEKKLMKNKKVKLQLQTAELHYLLEDFQGMNRLFNEVLKNPSSNKHELAAANLGIGLYYDMTTASIKEEERKKIASYFQKTMELGKDSPFEEEGLVRTAFYYQASSVTWEQGQKLIADYLKKYPKGKHVAQIKFREGMSCLYQRNVDGARKVLKWLETNQAQSPYTASLRKNIDDPEFFKFLDRSMMSQEENKNEKKGI